MTDRPRTVRRGLAGRRSPAPRQPPSIKRRITVTVALLVTLVLTLMAVASTLILRTVLDRQLNDQLSSITTRAQRLISTRAATAVTESQLRAAVPVGSFVICLDASGAPIASDTPDGLDQSQVLARVREAGPQSLVALETAAGPVRAVLVPVGGYDPPLLLAGSGGSRAVSALVIGFDTSGAERALHRAVLLEVGLAVAACGLILLLLPVTLDRGISPIRGMTEAAQAVAGGDEDRRLPADARAAETLILARAVNAALDARHDAEARLRQFVADASHELRTPLTTIEGWAELHRQGGLSDPQRVDRAMDRIAESASHLTVLVEDLALLARLDAGRPLQRAPVDVAALAQAVVDDLRVIDPARPVASTVPGPDAPVMVDGDEQRLRQVLLNLTGNVLQHTPSGTPVTVSVDQQGDAVSLSVRDAGPGIPADQQARIFDRFYRVAGTRSTRGTGLGLAIVRSLVDAHGGTVEVASSSAGTCFTVTLPALHHR